MSEVGEVACKRPSYGPSADESDSHVYSSVDDSQVMLAFSLARRR